MKPNREAEAAITGSVLEDILSYNAGAGRFYMTKTRGGVKAGEETGRARPDGYRQVKIGGRWFLEHRLAWVWTHGSWPPPGSEIDHANRDKADNRPENLRLLNRNKNCLNIGRQRNNTSGHTGVFWKVRADGRASRWTAYISVEGKRKYLGHFRDKEKAIKARELALTEQLQ